MGIREFEQFYSALYLDRWPALREAMLAPQESVPLQEGLSRPYFLDEASLIAAQALAVGPGDEVLDLCAAPGGKSLVLALAAGPSGSLVANDRSSARRSRLKRVIADHLPSPLAARVRITSHDAARWGLYERDAYDRVLVDVPCSSERHLLSAPSYLAKWSPARTRHLAAQGYAMLAAAVDAARPGGTILYSTCTLSPRENDEVVERILTRRERLVTCEGVQAPCGEPTRHGWIILPDRCAGRGPIYFARLRKRAASEQ